MFVRSFELPGLLWISGWTTCEMCACSIFLVVAREERAEAFFIVFCAPFVFFVAAFLFAFFNSDTVDLYSRSIGVAWVARWNGHQDIQAFHNLTKDSVPVIQMRSGDVSNKEL